MRIKIGGKNKKDAVIFIICDEHGIIDEMELSNFLEDSNIEMEKWIIFPGFIDAYYLVLRTLGEDPGIERIYDIVIYRSGVDLGVHQIIPTDDEIILFEIFFLFSNYLTNKFKRSR